MNKKVIIVAPAINFAGGLVTQQITAFSLPHVLVANSFSSPHFLFVLLVSP
jgi:hypothetical protein